MRHRYYNSINLVVLSAAEFSSDDALRKTLKQFFVMKGTWALIAKEYFTILAHGEAANIAGLNDQASLGLISNLYNAYGKERKILLFSCETGNFLSRDVAVMLKVQVIAPTGLATFDYITGGIKIQKNEKHTNPKWNKCYPTGRIEQSPGNVLEASFL